MVDNTVLKIEQIDLTVKVSSENIKEQLISLKESQKNISEQIEKLGIVEVDPDVIEDQEDAENTNDNHPLLNTFKKLVKKGEILADIAKQFREEELIEIGKEYGFEFTTKGSKIEKVKLIFEAINK